MPNNVTNQLVALYKAAKKQGWHRFSFESAVVEAKLSKDNIEDATQRIIDCLPHDCVDIAAYEQKDNADGLKASERIYKAMLVSLREGYEVHLVGCQAIIQYVTPATFVRQTKTQIIVKNIDGRQRRFYKAGLREVGIGSGSWMEFGYDVSAISRAGNVRWSSTALRKKPELDENG